MSDDEELTPEELEQRELWTSTWTALDEGREEDALALLERMHPEIPDRWTLAASVYVQWGELERAAQAIERARALVGSDDPAVAWADAVWFFHGWRFDEARAALAKVPPEELDPPAFHLHAQLADMAGDFEEGNTWMDGGASVGPDPVPPSPRLSPEAFELIVKEAAADLPAAFRAALAEIPVVIDPMPTAAILGAPASGHPPTTLGLFVGAPLTEQEVLAAGELRPTIFLFQRNIERECLDADELREQIRITLYHELGHALGFDEDGVEDMGLA